MLPPAERVDPLVRALEEGRILPQALGWALDDGVSQPERPMAEIVAAYRPLQPNSTRVRKVVKETAEQARELVGRAPEVRLRWAVGEAMKAVFGRVDPSEIRRQLAAEMGVPAREVGP